MLRRTLSYSISLLLALFVISLPLHAQSSITAPTQGNSNRPRQAKKEDKKKEPEIVYPLYNGLLLGVDLWGPGGKLLGSDFMSAEASVTADLKHRYFPTVEVGYGNTDKWSDDGIHYKSGAPFFRIGMDYNALYNKKHGHAILVGLRYAMSSFKYDVESSSIDDPIYGGSLENPNLGDDIWGGSIPYSHKGMKGNMHWLEVCVGIRAHVWKSLYMGWSIRMKYRLSSSSDTYGDPWYVPGFGEYGSKTVGVNYSIIYKLP